MCDYGDYFGPNASDRGFIPYEVRRESELERHRAKVAALEALEAARSVLNYRRCTDCDGTGCSTCCSVSDR